MTGDAVAPGPDLPFDDCRYLYVGAADVTASVEYYRAGLGAELVWRFHAFGTDVAAVRLAAAGPLLLLAGHRPARSCLPIWAVADLDPVVARLTAAGFRTGETVGTPDGPILVLHDPSGNELGFLRPDRPYALHAR